MDDIKNNQTTYQVRNAVFVEVSARGQREAELRMAPWTLGLQG